MCLKVEFNNVNYTLLFQLTKFMHCIFKLRIIKLGESDNIRYNQLRYKNDQTAANRREIMKIKHSSKIFFEECFIFISVH